MAQKKRELDGEDEYLSVVKKEAFAPDDDQVLMIDPGLVVEDIFGGVKLPCEEFSWMNNTLKSARCTSRPPST